MLSLIPRPTSITQGAGEFILTSHSQITAVTQDPEVKSLTEYLQVQLRNLTNWQMLVSNNYATADVTLGLSQQHDLGEEGYLLSVAADKIELIANRPAGLFHAIQTFLQLIPPAHSATVSLPAVKIRDIPRFGWRGVMLDVARHFFGVEDIKRFIDLIAQYKINRLHLHLTDDQGWRIEIKSWPRLAEVGGRTQVGGNGGGYYTQNQYREIVDYASSRYITVVPEIDTPGHTNAALASYAELNPSEEATSPYEGTEVGFSSLWINNEVTYRFLDDVIRELAALTPGPYIHIGGDEALSTPDEDYRKFIKRIQEIVSSHGKQTIGWSEIGETELLPGTIGQHWKGTAYRGAREQGAKIILSPANKTYLDMKYDETTTLGLVWAGLITVKDSYDWEPGSYLDQLEESDILGIEAPLWTETAVTMKDIEYLVFPRLIGLAELAWSPKGQRWEEYRHRLAAHGQRMEKMGVNFYRAPEVDW